MSAPERVWCGYWEIEGGDVPVWQHDKDRFSDYYEPPVEYVPASAYDALRAERDGLAARVEELERRYPDPEMARQRTPGAE